MILIASNEMSEMINNILEKDYRQFGGKGLVVDVKKGNKVKE